MKLTEGDRMISVLLGYEGDEVAMITKDGYGLRYSIDEIPQVQVKAKGVIGARLNQGDALACCTIVNRSTSEIVLLTDKSGAKRIKKDDFDVTKRATKGILMAKKNKTNPHKVRYIVACSLNDDLGLVNTEEVMDVKGKDITLMSKDARFSNPLTNKDWYRILGIMEVKIVDVPENVNLKSFENIGLEGLE